MTIFFFMWGCFIGIGCKDPYEVKVNNAQKSVLVVEGFLNGDGLTTVSLSRSFKLDDTSQMTVVNGATVTVESSSARYPLIENSSGKYSADLGQLNPSLEYRLHITTGGKEYVSDYVKLQPTPPIDSVGWTRGSEGVTLYASTHDPTNSSRYYRFDYEETWETRAVFYADQIYDPTLRGNNYVRPRRANEMVYQCWKSHMSTSLNLATSIALQNDVIHEKPLLRIPKMDEKLSVRYSILVKQYVLSKEAFNFFALMKKNTESLGTVFDPQPSEIKGNIHSVSDKNESVIGFFYASTEQQKRIFISTSEVPDWGYTYFCLDQKVPANPDSVQLAVNGGHYPFAADYVGIMLVDYRVADPGCFDCTMNGGSTKKPSFW